MQPLSAGEAEAHAAGLDGWTLDFPRLRRADTFPDFRKALVWVNRVGMLAEELDHHPDIHLTGWRHVELVLWTHAADGLTTRDFELARRVAGL